MIPSLKWPGFLILAAGLLPAGCDLGSPAVEAQKPDMTSSPGLEPPPAPMLAADLAMAPAPMMEPPPPGLEPPDPDLVTPPPPAPDLAMPPAPVVPPLQADYQDPALSQRQLSYPLALRTAALKLLGDLPTSDEILQLAADPNPAAAYGRRIDAYLSDPRFEHQLVSFFENTFRAGGTLPKLSLETAPTFAAELVLFDRPFSDVVTAPSKTCPTYSNGQFNDADCGNGVAQAAGVLTDPGVQALFISNMAFRRARWAQETFACGKFPAEFADPPQLLPGGGVYTSPWPFTSIAGLANGGQVDFLDARTLVCANCHSTLNHLAPLFANFDAAGKLQAGIQVATPIGGLPTTKQSDWYPNGEMPAWRYGTPVADLPALGRAIAADPAFATCMATRVYDWAMSKDDPVDGGASVPDSVLQPYRDAFVLGGKYRLKDVIRLAYTSDDFVRF